MPNAPRPIDADNHYYEPLDAFTRHQPKAFGKRGVQVLRDGKRTFVVVGDRVSRFIPNPTFDPVIVPGCIELHFRGEIPKDVDPRTLTRVEPIHPEYRDRSVRLSVMDEQGLAASLMFPTLGVGVEHGLRHDPEATMVCLSAFNRWLEEDWGFAHENRIFAAPLLSLADPKAARVELNSLLDRGAKILHVRPAPVPSASGPRSLGHRDHDPIWAAIAEANVPVAFHLGDSGYLAIAALWGGKPDFEPFTTNIDPLDGLLVDDRAIHDTLASLIVHGVFHRHPKLRVASIENGSDWLARLVKRLKKRANQYPHWFPEDPLEVIRRNVWVTPYYEENLRALADLIGVDKVLFGSDWPHGEGLSNPVDFTKELEGFSQAEVFKIMRDNARVLLGDAKVGD